MLVFDLRTLAAGAVQVDDVLPSDDPVWQAGDPTPMESVRVTGRLSAAGAGAERYYFSGQLTGRAVGACRRCLTDVTTDVEERVQMLFAEQGAEGADDPDVFLFDPRTHELDMRPAIREHWVLSAPAYVLCREECQGLCATCGADLNAGPCACTPSVDDRWAALRAIRQ